MPDRRHNKWLSLIAWLLPSCGFKLWALRSLGNHIGHDVVLEPNLVVNCGRFSIADGAVILKFNIFRGLSSIELGPKSYIGYFNYFTAAVDYQRYSPLVGKLMIGESGKVTNRHYVDCSGQVILRPFSAIVGLRCIILSHELDYAENKTEPGRVVLGSNAVTTVGCILLKDSYLPSDRCLRRVRCSSGQRRALSCRPPAFTAGPGAFHSRAQGKSVVGSRLYPHAASTV